MALLDLPNELLLSIADSLGCVSSIDAFSRTNRLFYGLLDEFLYRYYLRTSDHSAFLWAARRGLASTVRKFLERGANVGTISNNDKRVTALHLASRNGHRPTVELLVYQGADINAETSRGVTPLHAAVTAGHEHVTRSLLENGADFMKTALIGSRPNVLHIASYYGFTDIVQLLLERGMGIQVKDQKLQTPLHYAVMFNDKDNTWHGNLTTVNFLLEKKAVKDSWDSSGLRPKDIAKSNPNTTIQLLLQHTTSTTLNDAILLDQAIQDKRRREKELKEERIRKMRELATERAARRAAQEAEKKQKARLLIEERSADHQNKMEKRMWDILREQRISTIQERWTGLRRAADDRRLRRDLEETTKQIGEVKPTSLADQKTQSIARESWAGLRAEAEGRRQISNETKTKPCSHLLGLLKWKGKGRCGTCEMTFTKHLFKCADCSFVACRKCNTAK